MKNLLKRLQQQGFIPDSQTYATLLFLYSKQKNKEKGYEVLKQMDEMVFDYSLIHLDLLVLYVCTYVDFHS